MILYYVRHGDPTYNPDALTPLGHRQAEAVAKRVCAHGIDRVFSSTSNRAMQTAQPTSEILKKEITLLDFANEHHPWTALSIQNHEGNRVWIDSIAEYRVLFASREMAEYGLRWYDHPKLKDFDFKNKLQWMYDEIDRWLLSLGFEHKDGRFRIIEPNGERIALFAHAGFGGVFLSYLLDIPYPKIASQFDMCHTGMTVVDFVEYGECAIPRVLTYSSDSHIWREGLPTAYNNGRRK